MSKQKRLKLKGISRKGKNRIKQWGDTWIILRDDMFEGRPAFLVESICGKDWRWVHKQNDENFETVRKHRKNGE